MNAKNLLKATLIGVTVRQLLFSTYLVPTTIFAGKTLARVRTSKKVRCGVTEPLLGFSYQDKTGNWLGFNVDLCRAVAAAALGDAGNYAQK